MAKAKNQVEKDLTQAINLRGARYVKRREGIRPEQNPPPFPDIRELDGERLGRGLDLRLQQEHHIQTHRGVSQSERLANGIYLR